MPVQQLQIPSSNINNLVDPSTWTGLGNLGNVYQEAQNQARQQATLASLGTDPKANIAALLKSGDPTLVRWGLQQQQVQTENTRAEAELNIRKAAEARAQGNYDQAEEYRQRAADLNRQMLDAFTPGLTAPGGPSPFPAPLPGQNVMPSGAVPPQATPAMPPAMPPGIPPPAPPAAPPMPSVQPGDLDARIAQSAQQLPGSGAAYPGVTPLPAAAATAPPIAPPSPAAPPIKAEGEEGGLPAWAGPQSLAGRMINSLAAGQPAAAAGIDNKTLGEALANPETREIAKVFAANKLDPGTVKIEKTDDGRIIAIRTTKDGNITTKDVTPPTPGGGPPMNKEDRERQNIYDDAIKSGFSPQAALFMKFNKGKPPSESMTPTEIKTFNDLNNTARTADVFVNNLKKMQELSKNAYEGYGAQTAANIGTGVLGEHAPQAAIDTQKMLQLSRENAALQLRSTFGSRPAVVELQYLQQLESNPLMSRPQREDIYKRLIERFSQFRDEDQARAEAIKEGTAFKKGPGNLAAPPPDTASAAPPPPATAAAPSSSDDLAAAKWARDNPNDPRAQAIMQHLRGK